jgi:hypothetical protein
MPIYAWVEGVRSLLHMGQAGYISVTHWFLLHSTLNTTVHFNGSDGTTYTRLFSVWHSCLDPELPGTSLGIRAGQAEGEAEVEPGAPTGGRGVSSNSAEMEETWPRTVWYLTGMCADIASSFITTYIVF